MPPLPFRPEFVYDAGAGIFAPDLPLKPFRPSSSAVAGLATAASGARESYVIRRDQTAHVVLRIRESEIDPLFAFIEWAHANAGTPFTFSFDRTDLATDYSSYLLRPEPGEDIQPRRTSYRSVFEQELTLLSADGSRFSAVQFS